MRMAESSRTDESVRRTTIVKAAVRTAVLQALLQWSLFGAAIFGSFFIFIKTENPYAFLFLSLPIMQCAYIHFLGLVHQSGALKQMPDVHPLILWASAEDIVQARLGQAELPLELEDEVYGFFIPETRTITLV